MSAIDVQDLIQQGSELMAVEKYEAAKSIFEKAMDHEGRNHDLYIHYGNACVNLHEFDEGISSFKKALLVQPDSTMALYSLGCVYFLEDDMVEALKFFNKCEELGFATEEMYGIQAAMFLDAKDYVQALRSVNKAIRLNPLNPQHYIDKAQLFLLDGKPKEAVNSLHDVEELLPDAAEPYLVEVQLYEETEELDQAIAVANRAVERFPQDANMHLARARVLNSNGDYDEADKALAQASALAQGDEFLMRRIALQRSVSQVGHEDIDGSIATLEDVVNASEERDADTLYLLMSECFGTKRYEKAERYAKMMLALPEADPRFRAAAIFWAASSAKELGREEEARAAFEDATSTLRQITIASPGLLEVYIYRALAEKELGNFGEAHELVDHVIAMSPDTAAGYAFKADIYEAEGNSAAASEMRGKTHSIDPDFEF